MARALSPPSRTRPPKRHHVVYRIVDGDYPDWASWWGDWLLTFWELSQLLVIELDHLRLSCDPLVHAVSGRLRA